MTRIMLGVLLVGLVAGVLSDPMQARNDDDNERKSFRRIGTLGNYLQFEAATAGAETISEIIASTADGNTLVYTDGVRGVIGLIDITDPANPEPAGICDPDPDPEADPVYSPTAVEVLGNQYALVAADTSASFTNRSGKLVVIQISDCAIVREIELGGQPDSVDISPDGQYLAIAIENERNENLCVGGTHNGSTAVSAAVCVAGGGVRGGLPQTPFGNPAGLLAVIPLTGAPAAWPLPSVVNLTGLATYAPGDPEPEFVHINQQNEVAVTLQENNHLVIVDLVTLTIKTHFSTGAVTLNGVDTADNGGIALVQTLPNVVREPDAVAWVPGPSGALNLATANEGDLFGGTRGFSIFRSNGTVFFDTGTSFEELAVQHGHYPEDRSDNKGTEPEGVEFARFGEDNYLFVGSERGSFVAVYTLNPSGQPKFEQVLPAPLGPEGLLAIPQRNLLVASGENDRTGLNLRSTVMIYKLERGEPTYPQLVSDKVQGSPIPWSALSGLAAIPGRAESLLAVWDGAYSVSNIFGIGVSERPATITEVLTIQGGTGNYDPEGIVVAPDGTMWVATEGADTDTPANRLLQVDFAGNVIREVGLPMLILQCRAGTTGAFRNTLGSGFEGVAVLRTPGGDDDYRLIVAQQRGWNYNAADPACEALDDDAGGLIANGEPNWTRLWIYDPVADDWDHVAWELAPKPQNASWVGLSEITETPAGDFILIERDNRSGDFAVLKTLVMINRSALLDGLVSQSEKATYDLMPQLLATNGWITDKPEGLAVTSSGRTYLVTDNDGVENWNGETWFLSLGRFGRLFE